MKIKFQILTLAFLGISQIAFSQIKEERLILDKKRAPEVKRIEKKKSSVETVKNYPPKEKKIQDSLNLKYSITDVPAVSDFKTSTIQGVDIAPKFNADYQNNYVQFGMGNYGKILMDANISTTLENKMELGVDAHFLSTKGLTKIYPWSSKQNAADVGVFLNQYGELGKFNLNAEYLADDYNFYGIYALQPASTIDVAQKVKQIKINGYYDFYSNEILNDVRVKASFLTDHFSAKENKVSLLANLSKHGLNLNEDLKLNGDLGLALETQKTDFEILNQNSSQFTNALVSPKLSFFKGDSYLTLGSDFSFLNSKFNNTILGGQQNNSKAYWFPKAELLIAADHGFKFYAGVDGGLKLNNYGGMLQENPYLLPDQEIKPTETKYHVYFGLKGDVEQTFKYDVSAGFAKAHQIQFFKGNNLYDFQINTNRAAWDYANTFSAVYDNGSISTVKANLEYFPLENLVLEGQLNFTKYKLDHFQDIFNKPLLQAQIGGKYSMLNKKLLLGFKSYFVSDRTTNVFGVSPDTMDPSLWVSSENTNEKVGGYADINLSAEYKVHKNFSIFALGNNLLNTQYQTFKGYKVLGTQITAGIKISF